MTEQMNRRTLYFSWIEGHSTPSDLGFVQSFFSFLLDPFLFISRVLSVLFKDGRGKVSCRKEQRLTICCRKEAIIQMQESVL